ncbi:MAG: hypothetical protein SO287_05550, partial [Parabacteroides sp.]|nr:hypothetical protein [Parabacteroides sp.]
PDCVRAPRAREHYIILGIGIVGGGETASFHGAIGSWNIRGTGVNEMKNEAKRGCFAHFVAQ